MSAMTAHARKPLWRCPTCGQTFVGRNMPHSCAVVALDDHFAAVDPRLRALFDQLVAMVRENGPVTVNATKSRVAFQARMRFAGIERPRRDHLPAAFVLTRPVRSARLHRVEHVPPYYYVHRLRLRGPDDLDDELRAWLAEAYEVGCQRHVEDPGWPRERRPPDWVHVPS
jgi:uncharacterized protein DUF5655